MSDSKYTISDLEALSGIKAHTIRIWEKRYNIINPSRTDTNIRYYSNDDLKLLLNISFLNKNNFKISKIAEMSAKEIADNVNSINIVKSDNSDYIDNLIVAMIDLNEIFFEKIFSSTLFRLGFEKTIIEIIFPFLQRTGLMWQTGSINPAQEHFITNLIRQKLIVAMDSLPRNTNEKSPRALLFLPENELHENSLLFYNYILRNKGYHTYYFGQTVPLTDVTRIIEITNAGLIISVITTDITQKEFDALISELERLPRKVKILLSGRVVLNSQNKLAKRLTIFNDAQQLKTLI
ncbi:MAG: MerR family transcriptional regulator [Flavobacteriales bacterium]